MITTTANNTNFMSEYQELLALLLVKYKSSDTVSFLVQLKQQCRKFNLPQRRKLIHDWIAYEAQQHQIRSNKDNDSIYSLFIIQQRQKRLRTLIRNSSFILCVILQGISYLRKLLAMKIKSDTSHSSSSSQLTFRISQFENAPCLQVCVDQNRNVHQMVPRLDWLNDSNSLQEKTYGISQVKQFLKVVMRREDVDLSHHAPLLPELDPSFYTTIHKYIDGDNSSDIHLIHSVDALKLLKNTNVLVEDQIKFEQMVRSLFIEWFQQCRQCIMNGSDQFSDIIKDMQLTGTVIDNRVMALIGLSMIPSELHLLSFILDSSVTQIHVGKTNVSDTHNTSEHMHSWKNKYNRETKTIEDVIYQSKPSDISAYRKSSLKRRDTVRIIANFVSSVVSNSSVSHRSLADIESDIKNLLSNHPTYSILFSSLYNTEKQLGYDIGQWLKMYIPQNTTQQPLPYETIITRINRILNHALKVHTNYFQSKNIRMSERESSHEDEPLSIEVNLKYDWLDFESKEQLFNSISDHIIQLEVDRKKTQLADWLEALLKKVEEQRADQSEWKKAIFDEEYIRFSTHVNQLMERRKRMRILFEALYDSRNTHYSSLRWQRIENTLGEIPIISLFQHLSTSHSRS